MARQAQRRDIDLIPRKRTLAHWTVARCVLEILGFHGFWEFSKYVGISPITVSSLLYRGVRHDKAYFSKFAAVFEALTARYKKVEKNLDPHTRRYVKHWIQAWAKWTIKNKVRWDRKGRRKNVNKYSLRRREKQAMARQKMSEEYVARF